MSGHAPSYLRRSPSDFSPGVTFDFIWVGSLFTHLPEHSFGEWLKRLYSLLTRTGLLVFSTHDTHLMPPGREMPESGVFFEPLTEIPSIDTSDYGATIVTEQFVTKAVGASTGSREFLRLPGALNFTQDLFLVSKAELPSVPLGFLHLPYGYIDHCVWINARQMYFSGWALDYSKDKSIKEVVIYLNGEVIGRAFPSQERPDIVEHSRKYVGDLAPSFSRSGWSLTVDAPERINPFSDILLAKAISTSGLESVLRCGTLNTMLTIAY